MKKKFYSILLAGTLLISTACMSMNVMAGPVGPDLCVNSNDGYHHYVGKYAIVVKTTVDNQNHYMQAYKCSCGSMIATSDFPTDPYGYVGNYMDLDQDKINSAPGVSYYSCESIPPRDQYYYQKYTSSWHFTHTGNE